MFLACAGPGPGGGRTAGEGLGPRAARILSEAIRYRTVNPPGGEAPLAAYYVRLLREAGLEAALIETPSPTAGGERAAAWGLLRGSGARAPIVLLSHLDVVPATSPHWSADPFAGTVREGHVIGRGALDAKGVSVVHLLTLVVLRERGLVPHRDVVFLATPDEETGGMAGAGHLIQARPDLLREARYLLTEGGSVLVSEAGAPAMWGVGVVEKSPCWLRIVARGPGGHSSVPRPGLAVPRLVAALDRVGRLREPLRVTPEVARMFAALSPLAPPEDAAGFADLRRAIARDPAFRRRFLSRPAYAALVRNTATLTVLKGAPRTNVAPTEAIAHLDARLLPGDSCDRFADRVRAAVDDEAIRVEPILSFRTRASSTDSPLFRALERTAAEMDPGAVVVPRVTAGFTDSHWFRDLGLTAYGFVPRWQNHGEQRGIHAANEQISIENLERGIETMIRILRELDRAETPLIP